jgi:hypothetical protein
LPGAELPFDAELPAVLPLGAALPVEPEPARPPPFALALAELADDALLAEGAVPLPAVLVPDVVPDAATGPLDSCGSGAMLPGGTTTLSLNGIG